jgi:hypothetical protein
MPNKLQIAIKLIKLTSKPQTNKNGDSFSQKLQLTKNQEKGKG